MHLSIGALVGGGGGGHVGGLGIIRVVAGGWCSAELSVSRMNCGMVCLRIVSRGSCRAGHGHSQIQWRSESIAMQRGQCAFFALFWGSTVYRE